MTVVRQKNLHRRLGQGATQRTFDYLDDFGLALGHLECTGQAGLEFLASNLVLAPLGMGLGGLGGLVKLMGQPLHQLVGGDELLLAFVHHQQHQRHHEDAHKRGSHRDVGAPRMNLVGQPDGRGTERRDRHCSYRPNARGQLEGSGARLVPGRLGCLQVL